MKGFPRECSESELKCFFEEYGSVRESKIVRDRNGVSKGYAFITFETQEVADEVRDQDVVEFKEKRLSIGKAVRRKSGKPFGRFNPHFHQHRHEMASDGPGSHTAYYQATYSPSDGSVYYSPVQQQQQQQQHFVLVPAYSQMSPQMHYQSQNPYSQHSHSTSQPVYTTTAVVGNSYLPPSPYPYSWNEMALPMNTTLGVMPKVHPFSAENPAELAVASGQPAQIVSLTAIADGNYLSTDEVRTFCCFFESLSFWLKKKPKDQLITCSNERWFYFEQEGKNNLLLSSSSPNLPVVDLDIFIPETRLKLLQKICRLICFNSRLM